MGAGGMAMTDRERLAPLIKSTNQRAVIIELVRRHGWKTGAEIGVLRGKTLFSVLDACPGLSMIGVDQWKHIPLRDVDCAETYKQFDMRALETEVCRKAATYRGRCSIFKGDTVEQARRVQNGSLDFVFLDADHTEEGVSRDIAAWSPKVRAGGMVLGHDNHWPTVRAVIDERFPGWKDYGEAVWGFELA